MEEADITAFGKRVAKAQFAQYGMISVPEDVLDNYAKDMLKNKETLRNVIDRAVEEKLSSWLKEQVKLDVKEVSAEDFGKTNFFIINSFLNFISQTIGSHH